MQKVSTEIASAAISLRFEPSQRFVTAIARWLTEFCRMTLEDLELVSRVHMAVHELVENLVKYGATSAVRIEVQLERIEQGTVLRLTTRNTASPEHLEEAVRILTALTEARDPVAFYDQLVLDSAPRRGSSGLGLARIRAEGELDLDFNVQGRELSIIVEAKL